MLYKCIIAPWPVNLVPTSENIEEGNIVAVIRKNDVFLELGRVSIYSMEFSRVLLQTGVVGYVWLSANPYGWAWEKLL